MSLPDDRKYSETHEWHKVEGDLVVIGLTQHAVDQLTDVTYVEIQEPGTEVEAGGSIGEVESVKTTSDVYSAVTGEIAEINPALADDPGLLNRDPYGQGWLAKIKTGDPTGLDSLHDASTYTDQFAS
ncbi:MAG: glycine cleavage system protein GcvH [Planctomycetota bacterium]